MSHIMSARRNNRSTKNSFIKFTAVFILAISVFTTAGLVKNKINSRNSSAATIASVLPSTSTYDVVVVGGGGSGVAAALQAARQGVKVAILEETDWLGGQTASGVSTMDEGNYDGSYWQRTQGVYKEMYAKTKKYYDTVVTGVPLSMSTCYHLNTTYCPEPVQVNSALATLVQEVKNSGKTLDFYPVVKVSEVMKNGSVVTGVKTSTGSTVYSKVLIDATEYGDLIPLSGASYRVGNKTNSTVGDAASQQNVCIQDITYPAVVKLYSTVPAGLSVTEKSGAYGSYLGQFKGVVTATGSAVFDYKTYPVNWSAHNGYRGLPNPAGNKSYTGSQYQSGVITKTAINLANDYRANARYLMDKKYRGTVNCAAKAKTLDFLYYVQHDVAQPKWSLDTTQNYNTAYNQSLVCDGLPGSWATLKLNMPPLPYVRESMRVIGMTTLGTKSLPLAAGTPYTSARFPTSIGIANYSFDLHNCNKKPTSTDPSTDYETDLDNLTDTTKRVFQIPLETLIPQTLDGFLVAEKNISQSRLVNGATRLQPTVMTIGQAAGSLAARSVKLNVPPRKVQPYLVQFDLANTYIRLSPENVKDIAPNNSSYIYFQLAMTNKLIPSQMLPTADGGKTFNAYPGNLVKRSETAYLLAKAMNLNLSAAPTVSPFADVAVTQPYYQSIWAIWNAGLTAGCATNPLKFCPESTVSREQMSVFLVRSQKIDITPYVGKPTSFSDVLQTSTYAPYIEAAYKNGLTAGCGTNPLKYCPSDIVTRSQLWTFATKVLSNRLGNFR